MRARNSKLRHRFTFVVGIYALLTTAWFPSPAQVIPLDLPPRPTPVLTPTPMAPAWSPVKGYIELHVHSAQEGFWTLVQWQDGLGDWHDVEGWQGNLDKMSNGEGWKVWWVAEANYGQGPFRWVVCQDQNCRRVAISEPFQLPHSQNEAVEVEIEVSFLP